MRLSPRVIDTRQGLRQSDGRSACRLLSNIFQP